MSRPLFVAETQTVYRQLGRLTRDRPGSLFIFWAAGCFGDFQIGPTTESWIYQETVDGEEVIQEIVLPMTTKYLYFDENPVSPIRWLDGYYQLVAQNQEESVATDVSKSPTFSNVEALPSNIDIVAQAPPPPTSEKPVATDSSSKSSKVTKNKGELRPQEHLQHAP